MGYIVFSLLSCRHFDSTLVLVRKRGGKINLTLADMRHVAPLATETMFNGRLQDREFHLSFLLSLSKLAHGPEKSGELSINTMGEAGNSLLNSFILVKFDRFSRASSRLKARRSSCRAQRRQSMISHFHMLCKLAILYDLFLFCRMEKKNNRSMGNFLLLSLLFRLFLSHKLLLNCSYTTVNVATRPIWYIHHTPISFKLQLRWQCWRKTKNIFLHCASAQQPRHETIVHALSHIKFNNLEKGRFGAEQFSTLRREGKEGIWGEVQCRVHNFSSFHSHSTYDTCWWGFKVAAPPTKKNQNKTKSTSSS